MVIIPPGERIAQLLLLPVASLPSCALQAAWSNDSFASTGTPQTFWVAHLDSRPQLTINIQDKIFKGILDSGPDRKALFRSYEVLQSLLKGAGLIIAPEKVQIQYPYNYLGYNINKGRKNPLGSQNVAQDRWTQTQEGATTLGLQVPDLIYHPLMLPKSQLPDLDVNTWGILKTTFFLLNNSDPTLASDCWLCLTTGVVMPVAVPINVTISDDETCQPGLPFKVQPMGTFTECHLGMMQNNAYDVDVGVTSFGNCSISTAKKYSSPTPALCPPNGTVFMCGGNSAFPRLPANWTGGCVLALLLPDITIVPGDELLPIPSLDTLVRRHRRAIQALPLLATLGITAAVGTGTAGLGTVIHSYRRLSQQLIDDVQTLSGTIRDLQDQIDSLAEVVLQNRRGLDLLTANQGGICLALGERCCFYANKSGIVRTKIKELQEDLEKRRNELFENPLWIGMNGFLPYLLPLLGPLLGLLLIATLGPCIANRITQFIKDQINILTSKPIQVHYQRLEMDDSAQEVYLRPIRR
ncbi:LOW QUALITY PROTEIN: syncytin-1-like [Callospermophilus lateralis]|uniref:LOW QUALITY PROTEIN: syncytin-1-like n=1 Tax=Callospermophilus lateralis TaxID=76772 RepID=UPI004038E4CD